MDKRATSLKVKRGTHTVRSLLQLQVSGVLPTRVSRDLDWRPLTTLYPDTEEYTQSGCSPSYFSYGEVRPRLLFSQELRTCHSYRLNPLKPLYILISLYPISRFEMLWAQGVLRAPESRPAGLALQLPLPSLYTFHSYSSLGPSAQHTPSYTPKCY